MLRGVKLQLYPTYRQCRILIEESHRVRFLWNMFLDMNFRNIKEKGKKLSYLEMNNKLMDIKNDEYLGWYQPPNHAQMCQQVLKRLDETLSRWFGKLSNEPKFKSKKRDTISMTYPQGVRFNHNNTKIYIPSLGEVRCRGYRNLQGAVIKQLIIKVTPRGNIEATYIVECENQASKINELRPMIGIDVGTKKFLTDNLGRKILPTQDLIYNNIITNKQHVIKSINLKKELKYLAKLQAKAATRTTVNSKNKAYDRVNKQAKHITNIRINWLHHVANMYKDYSAVVVEDLNIKAMTKNISGTVDNPNKDSKRKSNLNRTILQQSWSIFFTILEYKLKDNHNQLLRVDPKFTSQRCSYCYKINKLSRNDEVYNCVHCGHRLDADHNAAINILDYGMMSHPNKELINMISK